MNRTLSILICILVAGCASRRAATTVRYYPPPTTPVVAETDQPEKAPTYFTFGSSREHVAAVMGTPDSVQDYGIRQVWTYYFSSVTFQNGAVSEWSNTNHNLKVRVPGASDGPSVSTSSVMANRATTSAPVSSSDYIQARGGSYTSVPTYYYPRNSASSSGYGSTPYHSVSPYIRRNGTFVGGHYRTNSDGSFYNNWSSSGNVNPFTGKRGYKTH
jgi:outer membrane protein assembly factor BamE (lipoprotein component of BamABCDE complex)